MKNLQAHRHSALDLLREHLRQDLRPAKLEEDKERIRQAYQDKGYFTAKVLDENVISSTGGGKAGACRSSR